LGRIAEGGAAKQKEPTPRVLGLGFSRPVWQTGFDPWGQAIGFGNFPETSPVASSTLFISHRGC